MKEMKEMKRTKRSAGLLLLLGLLLFVGCMRDADGAFAEGGAVTEDSGVQESDAVVEAGEVGEAEVVETEAEVEVEAADEETEVSAAADDGDDDGIEAEVATEPEPERDIEVSLPPLDGYVDTIRLNRSRVEITEGLSDMPWVTMLPSDGVDKSEVWVSSDERVATVDAYGRILGVAPGECVVSVSSAARSELTAAIPVVVYAREDVTEPTVIDGILIANKTYTLPADYNPGVDASASEALDRMIAGAAEEGLELFVVSGFRSFETQRTLYNNYVARDGRMEADRYSARPGHSEHQTGLAFDMNSVEQSFGETPEGLWLAAHCVEYGFIIRYPADKEEQTGYMYEPWHVRYLGEEVAAQVHESGLCLEEYLGITSVYARQ